MCIIIDNKQLFKAYINLWSENSEIYLSLWGIGIGSIGIGGIGIGLENGICIGAKSGIGTSLVLRPYRWSRRTSMVPLGRDVDNLTGLGRPSLV